MRRSIIVAFSLLFATGLMAQDYLPEYVGPAWENTMGFDEAVSSGSAAAPALETEATPPIEILLAPEFDDVKRLMWENERLRREIQRLRQQVRERNTIIARQDATLCYFRSTLYSLISLTGNETQERILNQLLRRLEKAIFGDPREETSAAKEN